MFAVPGWSVSADSLKAEQQQPSASAPGTKSRKRKRAAAAREATENVDSSNVADLYESVIEGKKSEKRKGDQDAKRQKKASAEKVKKAGDEQQVKEKTAHEPVKEDQSAKDKKKKKQKKSKNKDAKATDDAETESPIASKPQPITKAAPPAPKLTPLQASMREKLISARFRHLNETLYTRPSEESFQLFQDSPEMFDEYHEGFRRQVRVWPENPVDSFLADIRARGRIKFTPKGRPGAPPAPLSRTALPRTAGECTVADLGCGDARLAEMLQADAQKLRVTVRSFDLQSPSPLVTRADIADLPLADGSVNVAIFCLALMGTNWVSFVEEAYRVLHWKGELWVAEIKSRFGPVRSKHAPVTHSVGNRKKANAPGKKGSSKEDDDNGNDEDLAVEVDGADDRRRETDVSAFVDVLKARGFVLQGERAEAIDLSNKMFVKMHFIKGAAPTKGKGVKPQEEKPGRGKRPAIIRKIDPVDAAPEINEAAVLKPCVYKIR